MTMAKHVKSPTDLPKSSWWQVLKRTVKQFQRDSLDDWAAALTYYSVLSLFPGIIVLTSLLGLLGPESTKALTDNIQQMAPGPARDLVLNAVGELKNANYLAGPFAIVGLAIALWTASGYIGAFIRAANAIYEVEEGRPLFKTIPLRMGITLAIVVLLGVCAIGVVLTGGLADRVGQLLGIGSTGVLIWDIAKWPVIAILVSLAFALLYWASPNVRHPGFRWLTPGSVLAVLVWVLASVGFSVYVANFGSYNKTYGSLAGIVVFLVWLWLSNLAVLLGAELDAELARGKQIEQGHPEDEEPFLPPRDTRAMDDT
ncbi:YihY/virulence factor BrkB family protein [Kibdelosporangium aridum]|uniref:YihY/virulence factor BrkB family protein n=2 Tax=Kibdelosporangium aridum TaxID=2030 RepID=A0A428YSW5_KIBAR|nr:YihY/virulence factor BrkB family protein [Kibdelosporangium aridum]RSM72358.1 YihY/virulence factor BrkB family protein [Kibdelosporangium aridum]